ncbi:4-hydroxybenzoate polyprenyltransferase-like prenyltransferase [Beggiatoa alba B18LD]|uniref:4-hydroxybenzoate polyprenyltransferase-like prenyltransferase n=1 Tax=Beggiatoa alba B18LD TaxID=395493 RepID=I3CDB8_9GAMM|nr:UbiA family prenyltransferase [Beggiatoa alba]EIJ41611.1 4-hydroxybenzoate polyprenyltransferase-like prenyltransferase [Beggiatoa alba B18LD]
MTVNTTLIPLCVDLDDTLIKTDMLYEGFIKLLKKKPFLLLLLPFWLFKGKAYLKTKLNEHVDFDVTCLPYHEEFIEYLKNERQTGRQLLLVTASHESIAQKIADHLGIFNAVLATNATRNLKGMAKAQFLHDYFAGQPFAYAGDSRADLAVWQHAQAGVLVNTSRSVTQQAKQLTQIIAEFPRKTRWVKAIPAALRMHQWVKNTLIFIPLLASQQILNLPLLENAIFAFFAFSFAASSAYILNDLLDLEADRHHHRKRKRPFASGAIPIQIGLLLFPACLLVSLLLSLALPPKFWAVLGIYYVLTLAYSFVLKSMVLIDVFCLATLYTLRVIAGSAAMTDSVVSHWLLAFSLFIFLCLAVVKRHSEMLVLRRNNQTSAKGRGYVADDLEILASIGVSSGFISVLVLALYVHNIRDMYSSPDLLWFVCVILLYWISRVWLISHRGGMHDDPIVFALRDRVSHIVALMIFIIVLLAKFL